MPKCASSAIQSALSSSEFYVSNGDILYVEINANGSLVYGENLLIKAKQSPFQYSASVPIETLLLLDDNQIQKIKKELELLLNDYKAIILSNEGWGVKPEQVNTFFESLFDEKKAYEVIVIGYIRPQVDWFNSAWWQWGAWTENSLDRWLGHSLEHVNWYRVIKEWNNLLWVDKIIIRILNSDVISDFMGIINAKFTNNTISNKSLSGILLRFFQFNRELRIDSHDSEIEFILTRWLDFEKQETPWVLGQKQVENILNHHKEGNTKLLSLLDDESRQLFLKDTRWHSNEKYMSKINEFIKLDELPEDLVEELIYSCENAICKIKHKYGNIISTDILKLEGLSRETVALTYIKQIILLDEEIRRLP